MNVNAQVSFETFYFFELLEKIRSGSQTEYSEEEQAYLNKLVDYLESENDAQESIEKLAEAQSTSDLAIFFSDILDQVKLVSPEESMEKIADRVQDFLEIYQVFLQNDEWKAALDQDIRRGALSIEEAEETYQTFEAFCQETIAGVIEKNAHELPLNLRENYRNFAHHLLAEPDLSNQIEMSLDHPATPGFYQSTYTISQASSMDESAVNKDGFRKQVEDWAKTFRDIIIDNPFEVSDIFESEIAASPSAPEAVDRKREQPEIAEKDEAEQVFAAETSEYEEQPFEQLFEQADADIEAVEDETTFEEQSTELDSLVESISKRERRVPLTQESEEAKERRRTLRDYIIGEIESYSDEILEAFEILCGLPKDADMDVQLKEALKALKDLGQIHNYPAIETAADCVLRDYAQLRKNDEPFPHEEQPTIDKLMKLLPDYVDAVIAESPEATTEEIHRLLDDMHNRLFEVEPVSLVNSADTLEGGLQDVVARYARELQSYLTEYRSFESIEPVFENLKFWSSLLLSRPANRTLGQVETLLQPDMLAQLSDDHRQFLSDILKSWESSYATETDDVWHTYSEQLTEIQAEVSGAVPVGEAGEAFREVTSRQIRKISAELTGAAELETFYNQTLPAFINDLWQNSTMLGLDDIAGFAAEMQESIAEMTVDTLRQDEELLDQTREFLQAISDEINKETPAFDSDSLLAVFGEMITAAAETLPEAAVDSEALPEESAVAETSASENEEIFDILDEMDTPEVADEETVVEEPADVELSDTDSEDEMVAVFNMEAYSYLSDLNEYLDTLEAAEDDRHAWRQLGVTAHTLRGSAQMVGRTDIAELADPIDRTVDLVENGTLPGNSELVSIVRNIVVAIRERVNGNDVDNTTILGDLESFIAAGTGVSAATETQQDADFIYLSEQDPELLSIFQNEVSSNFEVIEKNLTNLEKFTYDKEAVQQIERAIHEIRAAAKMLGIAEIGSLADLMEHIFERLSTRQITNLQAIIPVTRRGMLVIRQLTESYRVARVLYDETNSQLEKLLQDEAETDAFTPPADADETGAEIAAAIADSTTAGEPEPFSPEIGENDYAEAEAETTEADEESPQVASHLLEIYLQEAHEQLDDISYLMMKLEKEPQNEELQHHLMRCMHTLKGSSGMVYAHSIEALTHRCEDILEKHLQDKREMPPELFDLLFEVIDEVRNGVKALESTGKESLKQYNPLMQKLDSYYSDIAEAAPEAAVSRAEVSAAALEVAEPVTADEMSDSVRLVAGDEETGDSAQRKDTYLRLNINKMNQLLNLSAEAVIGNNQFKNQLDGLKTFIQSLNTNLKGFRDTEDYLAAILREGRKIHENLQQGASPALTADALKKQLDGLLRVLKNIKTLQDELTSITHSLRENSKTYDENQQKLNKLSNELLDEILQARLVPINLLFQRFHRPIRDLARQLKKQIRLSLRGEETELDRTLVDELYEPLLHIIRNAIDHGLETTEERKEAGKQPEGLLEIRASRDRNQVIIEVRDDGRGIDLDRVKEKAIQKGLLNEKDSQTMTEQELFEYLFYPGFSTTLETTKLSGRGVGLDAVKSQIEKAKGDIRMYTELGKGTTFSIRVPISLSVIQSMLVDVNGYVYSVPLLQVEETLHVSGQDILKEDSGYYIRYRERKIPVIQLGKLLKIRNSEEKLISAAISYPVIMVQDEGNRVALLVDKIIRREEILIKSLGPGLRRLKYISGGSIMADGQVVLVLDVPQIVHDTLKGTATPEVPVATPQPPAGGKIMEKTGGDQANRRKKRIEGRKPVALIVDDSLSIRKYLSNLLVQKGYITDTARNGYEALELLNKQEFDIMVTDLEMPKLSGYELIETVRYDQRFHQFPIIVLTGRAGENFRQLTQELGADAYIVKPFKDRELFEQLERFIDYQH